MTTALQNGRTGTRKVQLCLHGVGCSHCEDRIRQALANVEGVLTVSIDRFRGCAEVIVSGKVPDWTDLLIAVENAGDGGAHRYWASVMGSSPS